jgi:hypothetical protein
MSDSIPLTELEGSSGNTAKFENIGDKHVGTVLSVDKRAQTQPDGTVVTFNDGRPRMQFVVRIQPSDGGEPVVLYARGGKFQAAQGSGESMQLAIGAAVRRAGATTLDAGGLLAVQFTGLSKPPQVGFNGAKLYQAQYQPPKPKQSSVNVDDLFDS